MIEKNERQYFDIIRNNILIRRELFRTNSSER
jgi:hypothetical protein